MKKFKVNKNITVEVSKEVFSFIRYSSYKERYDKRKDVKHKLIHYHAFDTDESEGENLIKDHSPLPDEITITNEMYNALYDALATLSIEEQLLLLNLYIKEESLRSIAYRQHSNPMNISRKRDRLLKKLATLLKKYRVS